MGSPTRGAFVGRATLIVAPCPRGRLTELPERGRAFGEATQQQGPAIAASTPFDVFASEAVAFPVLVERSGHEGPQKRTNRVAEPFGIEAWVDRPPGAFSIPEAH